MYWWLQHDVNFFYILIKCQTAMKLIYEISRHDHTNRFMTITKIIEFIITAIKKFSYYNQNFET